MVRDIISVLVLVFFVTGLLDCCSGLVGAQSLPPPEDIPEEVLQTQAIELAHSSLDGRAKSAKDYAQEQQRLRVKPEEISGQLNPEVHQTIFLLRLRKLMQGLLPFL